MFVCWRSRGSYSWFGGSVPGGVPGGGTGLGGGPDPRRGGRVRKEREQWDKKREGDSIKNRRQERGNMEAAEYRVKGNEATRLN